MIDARCDGSFPPVRVYLEFVAVVDLDVKHAITERLS